MTGCEYAHYPGTGNLLINLRGTSASGTLRGFVDGFLPPKRVEALPLPRDVVMPFREQVVDAIVERVAVFLHRNPSGALHTLATRIEMECLAFEAETIQIARSASRVYRTAVEVELETYLKTGKETNNVRFLPNLRPLPDQPLVEGSRHGGGLRGPAGRQPVEGTGPAKI